jgi:hypothetical protein
MTKARKFLDALSSSRPGARGRLIGSLIAAAEAASVRILVEARAETWAAGPSESEGGRPWPTTTGAGC